ncbi:MAG: cation:proton antiporter [Bacteroidota bacterium]
MAKLAHNELVTLLMAIAIMMLLSRVLAEFGRRYKLPMVMGELIVGILLGPTIFGALFPDLFLKVFPRTGNVAIALDGITNMSVVMLLFVAGMEVQLPMVLKQGRKAVITSLSSMIIPFVVGFAMAWYGSDYFAFTTPDRKLLFALFLGTAMSISALPVIARILMDLNLFKTKVGQIIIASAMFNDLIGWLIFSVILSQLENTSSEGTALTIVYVVIFGLFMLTIGKKIIDKALPWMQKKLSWPGGVLSISLGLCFASAALTESIGLHAILGAFICGIAFGDSVHLNIKAREIIEQFVINVFAPLFFVSIGLKIDFAANFDVVLVVVILIVAIVGKVVGAGLGAYFAGFTRNESLAIGFGLNARGAMEIILGTLALNAGLIDRPVFVALVVMALVTSILSGPMMRKFMSNQ